MISDENDFIIGIGNKIKFHRLERKMTQLDLAIKSGMEENALQRIEKGRTNPTIKTLIKIVNALQIDFEQLFELEK